MCSEPEAAVGRRWEDAGQQASLVVMDKTIKKETIQREMDQLTETLSLSEPFAVEKHLKSINQYLNGSLIHELNEFISTFAYDDALKNVDQLKEELDKTLTDV